MAAPQWDPLDPRYPMSVPETSELSLLSYDTLAYYRMVGKGPKWGKLGRRVYYRRQDVLDWMDAQFEGGAA